MVLDRVFEIMFARFRRRYGEAQLRFAWGQAASATSGFLVLPIAAAVIVGTALSYGFVRLGTPDQHTHFGSLLGVLAMLSTFVLLRIRFKKYLVFPPTLSDIESPSDRKYIFWFRASTVTIFIVVCLAGYLLRRNGVSFMQGL